MILYEPELVYPPLSQRMGEEGTVELRILVNERGLPEKIEIKKSSGYPRLDEAARQAAQRTTFKPYTEGGKAMPMFAIREIKFRRPDN